MQISDEIHLKGFSFSSIQITIEVDSKNPKCACRIGSKKWKREKKNEEKSLKVACFIQCFVCPE